MPPKAPQTAVERLRCVSDADLQRRIEKSVAREKADGESTTGGMTNADH
jgi:hypothetical protein